MSTVESSSNSNLISNNSSAIENISFNNKTETDQLFLKFLLFCNVDLDKVNSIHCQRFLHALNPSYSVPSSDEIKNRVLNSIYENMINENIKSEFSKMIGVIEFKNKNNSESYAISFVINTKGLYIYLCYDVISKSQDNKVELENFFNVSVTEAKTLYGITIKYLLYEGDTEVSKFSQVDNQTYQVIVSYKTLIHNLRHNHPGISISNDDDLKKYIKYKDALDQLQDKFSMSDYSLADATESVLKLVDDGILTINPAMSDIIQLFNPVALVANYLEPTYKGRLFTKNNNLMGLMYEYLFDAAPSEIFTGFANYKDETNKFRLLFHPNISYDSKRFWHIVAMDYPQLSSYALEVLALPANLKKVHLENLKEILFSPTTKNTSDASKAIMVFLSLNE